MSVVDKIPHQTHIRQALAIFAISPVKQRRRLGVTPEKGRPEIIQPP
jgi:hypothetical protein